MENLLDDIHTDPRWLPLLRKAGYAPEQLAKIEFKVTMPQAASATASGGSNKKPPQIAGRAKSGRLYS